MPAKSDRWKGNNRVVSFLDFARRPGVAAYYSPVPSNPPPLTEGHLHGSSQRAYSQVRYKKPSRKSMLRESKVSSDSEAQRRMSPLWLGTENLLSSSAQRVSSPARPRGPPLGFGTGISSYLARAPTPCRRFAMGVPLNGMGVRQPYVDTYSFIQNRRETKETSYALAFEGSLYSGDLYWGYKLAFSVCLCLPPSLCLSVEVPGLWRGNGSGNLHQIFRVDRPTRRTRAFVLFKAARRMWHVARAAA